MQVSLEYRRRGRHLKTWFNIVKEDLLNLKIIDGYQKITLHWETKFMWVTPTMLEKSY